nr:VanZ family protein [Corynebacterium aquatimens]
MCVVIALTMLKAFYRIGYLWDPANQMRRGVSLLPLDEFVGATSWFKPIFEYGGNVAFFIPVGMLAYILFERSTRQIMTATLFGAGFSLLVEVSQYVFALGFSDIDDLVMNTLGAFIGATLAKWCGPKLHGLWVALSYVAAVVFVGLLIAGESLGDPSKIKNI